MFFYYVHISSTHLSIDINLKSIVYCDAIKRDETKNDWNFARKRFEESTVESEKKNLLHGLTCTKDICLNNRYTFEIICCFFR